ncbi:MAG: hypothetical protein ABW215_11455 [Kibdelosporangium sp.]
MLALPWLAAGVRALVDALPNARYEALDGQSHDVADDVIAPVLAAFFTEER